MEIGFENYHRVIQGRANVLDRRPRVSFHAGWNEIFEKVGFRGADSHRCIRVQVEQVEHSRLRERASLRALPIRETWPVFEKLLDSVKNSTLLRTSSGIPFFESILAFPRFLSSIALPVIPIFHSAPFHSFRVSVDSRIFQLADRD